MNVTEHQTVLLEEAVHALITKRHGNYVDGTYGRGGHSQAIADELDENGRLLVIDRDRDAIAHAVNRFAADPRVKVQHGPFSAIKDYALALDMCPLDGVLLDLGVSSPQLDLPGRGFSFTEAGPLDMRMDQGQDETAAEWLARASVDEITSVLKRYGEERYARRIARRIVEVREIDPIESTDKLVEIVETAIPRRDQHKHPATRTFQAIRIQINRELQELESCLHDVIELLNSGGRLVIISFHSLEDRLVKRFFRKMERGDDLPSRLPVRDDQLNRQLKVIGKPVRASREEIETNRRARSSIMRVAEKL